MYGRQGPLPAHQQLNLDIPRADPPQCAMYVQPLCPGTRHLVGSETGIRYCALQLRVPRFSRQAVTNQRQHAVLAVPLGYSSLGWLLSVGNHVQAISWSYPSKSWAFHRRRRLCARDSNFKTGFPYSSRIMARESLNWEQLGPCPRTVPFCQHPAGPTEAGERPPIWA